MRHVAVMGKGALAIQVADWFRRDTGHQLRGVVPVEPEPDWAPSLRDWAARENVTVFPHHSDVHAVDLVFTAGYDEQLGERFLARHGRVLNIHFSELPWYRGARPINWALLDHRHTHGVSIHEVDGGVNTGPVVAQARFDMHPEWEEVRDVYHRCVSYGWLMFRETIQSIDRVQPTVQENSDLIARTAHSPEQNHLLGERAGWTVDASRLEFA